MNDCVIFGAGKIARGFIGHLLYLSGQQFVFIDKNQPLTDLINERQQYTVNILGAPEKNTVVKGAKAISYQNRDEVTEAVSRASVIFTAVGGKNLNEIVPFLARGLKARFLSGNKRPVNIITCENWKMPAALIRKGIEDCMDKAWTSELNDQVGVTEAVVMRSAIEADAEMLAKDPLVVNVQDFWELPVDASRLKGVLPEIMGVKLIQSFEGFLERKFYTYNAANGTVSYLGYIKGYERIADAAHDREILQILEGVYQETSRALSAKHRFPLDEQLAFTRTSLKKLQDYTIVDSIERNARDPIRKLGPDDRLVGSARLVLDYGGIPENLAAAIAAALFYDNPADPIALEFRQMRETYGIDYVLENVCKIVPQGQLGMLIKEKIHMLQQKGWLSVEEVSGS